MTTSTRKTSKNATAINTGARASTAAPAKKIRGDETLRLMSIVTNSSTQAEVHSGLIQWLNSKRDCAGSGIFTSCGGALQLDAGKFSGPAFDNPEMEAAIQEAADTAARTATTQVVRVKSVRNIAIVAVPVAMDGGDLGALAGAIVAEPDEQPGDSFLMTAAAYATLWQSRRAHTTTRRNLTATAAVLDLLRTIEAAETFRSATVSMVNALHEHLRVQGVVLGFVKGAARRCRVEAISGLAGFDSSSSRTRMIEDALDECLTRDRLTIAPPGDPENRDTLLLHEKLRSELQAERIVSHPLQTGAGEVIGAWLAIEDSPAARGDQVAPLMRAAAPRVAEGLALARRADSSLFGNRRQSVSRWRWTAGILAATAVLAAVMCIPAPYRIYCECSAEPEVRRFIVAPNDGLIEKTFVEPGDVVDHGQLLAKIDGRDVRWELAGLAAEKEQARKDHDSSLIEGDAAGAQRANLELKRIEAHEKVLNAQRDQLELTSPLAGIVLDGHLDRVENAPVTIGQAIYEIAPLSPVSVEVAINGEEFANVRTGYQVTLRFDGLDKDFTGKIRRIHPRSELRNGVNVFIAEVMLPNDEQKLRPGMSGYARIHGQTHSLGWNLFHRPWEHLRKTLPF